MKLSSSPVPTKENQARSSSFLPNSNRARVEGVAMIKRHLKKSQEHPNGTIAEREGSIHVSNLQLKTRFDGSKRRVAKALATA
jgi:large subunit ribosomal protein L24